jgi:hypothetical protein
MDSEINKMRQQKIATVMLVPKGIVTINSTTNNAMYSGFLTPEIIDRSTLVSHTIAFASTEHVTWPLKAEAYNVEVLIWKDDQLTPELADSFSFEFTEANSDELLEAGGSVSAIPSDIASLIGK